MERDMGCRDVNGHLFSQGNHAIIGMDVLFQAEGKAPPFLVKAGENL
jgi:hypothetical protein